MPARILVVDDEQTIRWTLKEFLSSEGYDVLEAPDGASANAIIGEDAFDLALLDQRLPDTEGMALLRRIHETAPDTPVIIITAFSSINDAVAAMRAGAFDYVTKPFNMAELAITIARALETSNLRSRIRTQVSQQKTQFNLAGIIGEHPSIAAIRTLVSKIAKSGASTVLLLGESGTGKDLVARAVHYESERADKPFMNITCSALPDNLLESELFGHEKGAFTDAKAQKRGLFELAHGGTVFMDEIGEMSTTLQAKLLRVLEEKAFRRVGGTVDVSVDVRVVASTNRDLQKDIEERVFREDLYYRLSILPIVIPPLRERREDIPLLAEHFRHIFNQEFHRQVQGFAPAAYDKMRAYHWPGNVRELRNVVERAFLLSPGNTLTDDDILLGRSVLGHAAPAKEFPCPLPQDGCDLADVERGLIVQALERTHWNQTHAARLLGLSRDQMRHRITKFGLQEPSE